MNLSYTQLKSWRRCRLQYKWRYVDHVPTPPSSGLLTGDAGHQALAVWYGGGTEGQALAAAERVFSTRGKHLPVETLRGLSKTLAAVLKRYFVWSTQHDDWRSAVQHVEYKVDLPLAGGHRIVGYLDLVLGLDDGVWIAEHKFVKDARTNHLLLDTQCTTYCALYWMQTAVLPRGVIYNSVRMRPGGIAEQEPALRTQVTRTKEGLELAWQELLWSGQELLRVRERYERGAGGPLTYRNATHDCSWDCSFYRQCCALELTGDYNEALKTQPALPRQIVLEEETL